MWTNSGHQASNFGFESENTAVLTCQFQAKNLPVCKSEVEDINSIVCASSHLYLIAAVDKNISIFKEESSELFWEIETNERVSCISLSDDSCLLLVADFSGEIRLIHISTKTLLWNYTCQNGESSTIKEAFIVKDSAELLKLLIFTNQEVVYEFSNISVPELYKAAETQNVQNVFEHVHLQKLSLSEMFPNCEIKNIFPMFGDSPMVGLGVSADTAIVDVASFSADDMTNGFLEADWEYHTDERRIFQCFDFSAYGNAVKAVSTKDGRYIVFLNEKHDLNVMCSFTSIILKTWKAENGSSVVNFVLNETVDPSSSLISDCKIGLLIAPNSKDPGYFFEIRNFPSFDVIFNMNLSNFARIADCNLSQEFWCIIDGELNLDDSSRMFFNYLNVKEIFEASPEARLMSLVSRRKFSEAKKLVEISNMNAEVIYKTKINCILNSLSTRNGENFHQAEMENQWNELEESLKHITDLDFVYSVLLFPLPDGSSMKKVQFCVRNWVIRHQETKGTQKIISKVNPILCKLTTYELICSLSHPSLVLTDFLESDLLKYMISELQNGNIKIACIIWQRHKDSFLLSLNEESIEEIITAIPDSLSSRHLIPFLCEDFLPFLFSKIPTCVDMVADWLIHRIYLMEFSEKDLWPENGMSLVTGFLNVVESLREKEKLGEMSFSGNLFIFSIHKKFANKNNPLWNLAEFSKALTWLIKLKSLSHCKVPLSEFQNSKMNVIFTILDDISVSKISKIVDEFVTPYALEHELELNFCLEKYIEKTFQASCPTQWLWDAEPWEERLIAVTENIYSINCWQNAALMIVSRASVPWSEKVKKLVQKGIEYDCEKSKDFKIQAKLVGLKEVLLKYELRDFPINNDVNLIHVLVNYMFTQNKAEVVNDVKKVLISVSDQSHESDIYFKYLQFALNRNKTDQMMEVFLSLPESTAVTCAKRLLQYIKLYLDQKFFVEEQNECITNMLCTGLHLVEFLKKRKQSLNEELELPLKNLLKLREQFNICMTFSEIFCKLKCQSILETAIKDFLITHRLLKKDTAYSDKKQSPTCIFRLYRLGRIFSFEREEVMAFLITNCLQEQEYDLVLKLCKELTESFPSSNVTQVLMQVSDHFYQNFQSIKDINFGAMINTIYHLSSVVATYCKEDFLEKCMDLVHLSTFLSSIKNISGQLVLPIAPEYTMDSYHKWKFYPLYSDEGFQLDCSNVTDFVIMAYSSFVKQPNDALVQKGFSEHDVLLNSMKDLIKHMMDRGHEVAALRALFYYFHMRSKLSASASDIKEVYCSIVEDFHSLTYSVVQKVLSQRRTDLYFAYSLLYALPEASQFLSLKSLINWCSSNLHRLSSVAQIGMEVSKSLQKNEALSIYENIYRKASLLSRSNVRSVPMEIILHPSSHESSWPVVKDLILTEEIDLPTVHECCSAFQLPTDNVSTTYLNYILLESEKKFLNNGLTDGEVKHIFEKATTVINCIKDDELLCDNFRGLMKKFSPYSYEFLIFTEKILNILSASLQTISTSSFEKNIKILKFLMIYERSSPVTEMEINRWCALHPANPKLPDIASKRLPFHFFCQENSFSIINPELSSSTLDVWLKIGPVLRAPEDHLIIIAVKNTVLKYLEQHASPHIILDHDVKFVDTIDEMISKVKEPESSLACASWVANQMPSGGNKFAFASMAVDFAQQWYEQSPTPVLEVFKKLVSFKQQAAVENALYKSNLASNEIISLKQSPSELIEHLVEEFSSNIGKCIIACKAISEISEIVQPEIDLIKIILKFIFKWLNVTNGNTAASNLDESFLPLSPANVEWEDDHTDDRNLFRIMNLLLSLPQSLFQNLFRVLQDNFKVMPSVQRARLLFCFVAIFDIPTIAKALEWDHQVLDINFIPLQCSVELENLKLPYSLQTFIKCNKTELVQRILSTNLHNPKAVLFCIQLCIEYNIWDKAIWEVILRRMTVKDGRDYPLQGILQSVQGQLPHLWHSEAFKHAWKCILSRILTSFDDSTTLVSKLYKAALSCPCISSMDDFFTNELNCMTQTFEENGLSEILPITDASSFILNLMKVMKN